MATLQYKYDLDMGPRKRFPTIVKLSQYDEDFELVFRLHSEDGALDVRNETVGTVVHVTTAEIRGTKSDGNGYSASCDVGADTDGTPTVTFVSKDHISVDGDKHAQQMTAVAGKTPFELTLYHSETESGETTTRIISTGNFLLEVERAPLDLDTLPSDSVIRELYEIDDHIDDIIDAADTILNAIDPTLSVEGAAAEASVVGSYLNDNQIIATEQDQKDYNLITTPGKYINGTAVSVANTLNKPTGMTAPHKLYVIKQTNAQRISQIILSNTTDPGVRIYKRFGSRSGSAPNYTWSWSAWNEIMDYTTAIDATLTQSGKAADAATVGASLNETQIVSTESNPKDYNDYTVPGKYWNGTTASVGYTLNKPSQMTSAPHKLYVIKLTTSQNNLRIAQVILANTSSPSVRMFKRYGTQNGETWTWYDWNEVVDDITLATTIDAIETEIAEASETYTVLPAADFLRGQIDYTDGERKSTLLYRISTPDIHEAATDLFLKPAPGYVIWVYYFVNGVYQAVSSENAPRIPITGVTIKKGQQYKISIGKEGSTEQPDIDERHDKAHFFNPVQKQVAEPERVNSDYYSVLPVTDFRNGRINHETGAWVSGSYVYRISTPDIHEAPCDLLLKPAVDYVVWVYYFTEGAYQAAASENAAKVPEVGVILPKGQQYKISIGKEGTTGAADINERYDKAHFFNPVQKAADALLPKYSSVDFGIVPGGNFYHGVDEVCDAFPFGGVTPTPITATAGTHYDLNSLTTTGIYSVAAEVAPYVDNAPSEVASTAFKVVYLPIEEPGRPTLIGRQYIITDDTVRPYAMRNRFTGNWGGWKSDDTIVPMMYDATPEQVYAQFHALASAHSDYIEEYQYTDGGNGNIGTWSQVAAGSAVSDVMSTAYGYVLTPNRAVMSNAPTDKKLPTLFIISGSHGYEKASVFSLYYLLKHIIENTVESPVLRYLRRHCRIVVMPCINPYGFYHKTYTNGPVGDADTPESEWGVNLNRNWDCKNWVQWDATNPIFWDASDNVDYKQYTGTNPFSEWETRAVRDLFDIYKDNIVFAMDYHTCGRTWSDMEEKWRNVNNILFTPDARTEADKLQNASSYHIADVTAEFIEQFNLGFDPTLPEWSPPRCGTIMAGASHTVNTAKDFFDLRDVLGCTFETFPSFKYTGEGTQPNGGGYSSDVIRASEELISNYLITVLSYLKG